MKTPWTMKDYNGTGSTFRPVDIFDASGNLMLRISSGEGGVKIAEKIVRCVNSQALFDDAGIIFAKQR